MTKRTQQVLLGCFCFNPHQEKPASRSWGMGCGRFLDRSWVPKEAEEGWLLKLFVRSSIKKLFATVSAW